MPLSVACRPEDVVVSLVSVIVAARNEAARIEECVTSLLAQDGVDVEVVVVDDGSTDSTAAVLERLADPRLVVLRNETSEGRGAARNRALRIARGDIVAIQDADDIALPGKLRTLTRMLDDPALVAVGGQCISQTPRGHYWLHTHFPTTSEEIATRLDNGVMGVCHTASAIRRDALEAAGGYSAEFPRAQDLELFRRLAAYGPMRNTNDPLVIYRHPVLLSWSYWSATREAERRMTGRPAPAGVLRVLRYAAANGRRVARYLRSSRHARLLVEGLAVPDGTARPAAPTT